MYTIFEDELKLQFEVDNKNLKNLYNLIHRQSGRMHKP